MHIASLRRSAIRQVIGLAALATALSSCGVVSASSTLTAVGDAAAPATAPVDADTPKEQALPDTDADRPDGQLDDGIAPAAAAPTSVEATPQPATVGDAPGQTPAPTVTGAVAEPEPASATTAEDPGEASADEHALSDVRFEPVAGPRWCVVNVDMFSHLNVRAAPSTDAAVVTELAPRSCPIVERFDVPVDVHDPAWLAVTVLDTTRQLDGWVHRDHAQPAAENASAETVALDYVERQMSERAAIVDTELASMSLPAGAVFAVPDARRAGIDGVCDITDVGTVVCAVSVLDAAGALLMDFELYLGGSGIDHVVEPGADVVPLHVIDARPSVDLRPVDLISG